MPDEVSRRARLRGGLGRLFRPDGPEMEAALEEVEERHRHAERTFTDMAEVEDLPFDEFNPESHLAPGVPRLRTLLVALAAKAAGPGDADPTDVAHVAEFLHLAVVIHDTALGRQSGRRRRVARRLLGGAAHWLGGNHLTLRALELARAVPTPEVMGEVIETMREISEGQLLSEELRHRDASLEDYIEYAENHSGAIYSFCARAGAQISRADRGVTGALGRFGRHLGVAWHAVDDLWLFEQDADELSHHLARRTAMGRPVLPIIKAMEVDSSVDEVVDRLCDGEEAAAAELLELVKRGGGLNATRQLMVERSLAAKRTLRAVPASPYRDLLERVAVGMSRGGHAEVG